MSSTDDPTVSAGSNQPDPAQPAPAAPAQAPAQPVAAAAPKASTAEAIVKHAERSITEEPITAAARERAEESGANPVTPAVGALLSVLAKIASAKAVVEVGTGAGVSGLWLLSGMREDGVLTTIDIEPEHQRLAKQAFVAAGVGPSRTRLIVGRAQEVLTRLADESYDLVFIDGEPVDQPGGHPRHRRGRAADPGPGPAGRRAPGRGPRLAIPASVRVCT